MNTSTHDAHSLDHHARDLLDARTAARWGQRVVSSLLSTGVAPQSFVVFQAPNSPALVAAIYGTLRAGLAPVVIGSTLTDSERDALLADLPFAALVREDDLARYVSADDVELSTWSPSFACRPLHFTSGTSGRPKAVWSGWLSDEDAHALVNEERATWGFASDDVHLVSGPLSHSAPLRFALHTLLQGGSVVVPARFDAGVATSYVESIATTAFMAPVHLQRIFESAPPRRSALRLLAHAGSACPEPLHRRALTVFDASVLTEFYGSTEGQFTLCPASEWLTHPGTVGRARDGRSIRADAEGRLWCRAPGYARFEYWNDPEKTNATWDGDWFTVGDVGRVDEEGYVYLEGRRSDLIISGGVNVYPSEIESVLATMPDVGDVAAFGRDDATWGQRVCVVYTGQVSTADVAAYATSHLAPYKRPKTIQRVEALPRTHNGKVERSSLAGLLDDEQ